MPALPQVGVEAIVKGAARYASDARGVGTSTSQMTGAVKKAGGSFASSAKQMLGFGAAIAGVQLGVQLVRGALQGTIGAAIGFESAFAGVKKTVDGTEAELQAISDGFREMAQVIPITAVELAGVGEAAGQLGIATQDVLVFVETMALLGVTTNLSAQEAAVAFARIANITGLASTEFDNMASAVVDLGNNFATTEAEIVNFTLRLSGAGTQIGLTEAEILGFATALASVGLRSEAAGTAFSRVMIEIANAAADGGEELTKFAAVAGVTSDEFQRLVRESPAEALTLIVEGLARMSDEGANVFAVLEELGLSNIRVRDTLLRLAQGSDIVRDALATANTAWGENTALTLEAEKRFETTASKLGILKNTITDAGISLGTVLLPAIVSVAGGLTGLISGSSETSATMKVAAIAVGLFIAALVVQKVVAFGGAMLVALASVSPMTIGLTGVALVLVGLEAKFGIVSKATKFLADAFGFTSKKGLAAAASLERIAEASAKGFNDISALEAATNELNDAFHSGRVAVLEFADGMENGNQAAEFLLSTMNRAQIAFEATAEAVGAAGVAFLQAGGDVSWLRTQILELDPAIQQALLTLDDGQLILGFWNTAVTDGALAVDVFTATMDGLEVSTGNTSRVFTEGEEALRRLAEGFALAGAGSEDLKQDLGDLAAQAFGLKPALLAAEFRTLLYGEAADTAAESTDVLTDSMDETGKTARELADEVSQVSTLYAELIGETINLAGETTNTEAVILAMGQQFAETGGSAEEFIGIMGSVGLALTELPFDVAIDQIIQMASELGNEALWQDAASVIVPAIMATISDNVFAALPELVSLANTMGGVFGDTLRLAVVTMLTDSGIPAEAILGMSFNYKQSLEQEAARAAPFWRTQGGNLGSSFAGGVADKAPEVEDSAETLVEAFENGLARADAVARFGEAGVGLTEAFEEAVATGTTEAMEKFITLLLQFMEESNALMTAEGRAAGRALVDSMAAGIDEGAGGALEAARRMLEAMLTEVDVGITDIVELFTAKWMEFLEDRQLEEAIGAKGVRMMDALLNAILEGGDAATEAMANALGDIMELVNSNIDPSVAGAIMSKLFEALLLAVADGGDAAVAAVEAILAQIQGLVAAVGGGKGGKPELIDVFGINLGGDLPAFLIQQLVTEGRISEAVADAFLRARDDITLAEATKAATGDPSGTPIGKPTPVGPQNPAANPDCPSGSHQVFIGFDQATGVMLFKCSDLPAVPTGNAAVSSGLGLPGPGVGPSFHAGTTNVPHDMAAFLHGGEMVIPQEMAASIRGTLGLGPGNVPLPTEATPGGGTSIVVDLSHSNFTGTPTENAGNIREAVDSAIRDNLTRGAFAAGVRT